MISGIVFVLILLLLIFLPQNRPATNTSIHPQDSLVVSNVFVDNVDILVMESFPVQVNAVVKGTFPDPCTRIDEIRKSFENDTNTFLIEINAAKPADTDCRRGIDTFEEVVELDVQNLVAGTYTVNVNGVEETFTLSVDNTAPGINPEP